LAEERKGKVMSRNLGTRRPSWCAKLFYVAIAFALVGFVAFAFHAVSEKDSPARGSAGPLTEAADGRNPPPTKVQP
jgi:hypothetical protein